MRKIFSFWVILNVYTIKDNNKSIYKILQIDKSLILIILS